VALALDARESVTRDAVGATISDANVTAKKRHRQRIRRFLTGSSGARNALSYTKRRRVRASAAAILATLTIEGLVSIGVSNARKPPQRARRDPGTGLAPRPFQQIDFGTINGPRH
jgi:hypothetical protein